MKWIFFFLLCFVGIFTGLMFATGIAQKQVIPMVKQRFAATGQGSAPKKDAAAGDSTGAATAAKPAADSLAAAPKTAAAGEAAAQAPAAAAAPDAVAQQNAVSRAVPKNGPRSAEQQTRDALIAKVYAEMKPDDAAKILARLDEPTALAILSHFKAPAAARLLEAMGPERSVRMTQMWASGALAEGGTTP